MSICLIIAYWYSHWPELLNGVFFILINQPLTVSLVSTAMPLRSLPTNKQWSSDVITSTRILADIYQNAKTALDQQPDKHRVLTHAGLITETAIPLLEALADSLEDIPVGWLQSCTNKFGALLAQLQNVEQEADGQ
jgi:hypothetical protein